MWVCLCLVWLPFKPIPIRCPQKRQPYIDSMRKPPFNVRMWVCLVWLPFKPILSKKTPHILLPWKQIRIIFRVWVCLIFEPVPKRYPRNDTSICLFQKRRNRSMFGCGCVLFAFPPNPLQGKPKGHRRHFWGSPSFLGVGTFFWDGFKGKSTGGQHIGRPCILLRTLNLNPTDPKPKP